MRVKSFFIITFICICLLSSCKTANSNSEMFTKSALAVSKSEIILNDITSFDWDCVYTFIPYYSKEKIEDVLGFKSADIKETVNEGMEQLIFVKGNKVVCNIYGYAENLKYSFDFGSYNGSYLKIDRKDKLIFKVSKTDGIIQFTYTK